MGFLIPLNDLLSSSRPETANVLYPASRNIVEGTWQKVEPVRYCDTGRYTCKKATKLPLTARRRLVRECVSQALKSTTCRAWVSTCGNIVGCSC